jgi:hypothetical protein
MHLLPLLLLLLLHVLLDVVFALALFFSIKRRLLLLLLLLLLLQVLYDVDFALALFFSANWLLWFWLAEDRLRYVFSLMSLIDAITIIPAFVLYRLEVCVNNMSLVTSTTILCGVECICVESFAILCRIQSCVLLSSLGCNKLLHHAINRVLGHHGYVISVMLLCITQCGK